jgi:hypothetical protein
MKALTGLASAAVALVVLSGAASAQTTPSDRPCKQGEQMIGGVCKPLTRTAPVNEGNYSAPRTNTSRGATRTASAQKSPSSRACKRGEQRIGGVCKPLTRSAPR